MLSLYMLFNSYEFIFIFLVPVVLMYRALHVKYRIWFLIVVSVVFYAQWSLEHLFILLSSIVLNYVFALRMSSLHVNKKAFLAFIVVLNLIPLGYFKYAGFLHVSSHSLVLPLAISFFTFQQIAFVVDVYKGQIKIEGFREYLFFVIFFPQLVAGPIVHYNELIPQVESSKWKNFNEGFFSAAVVLFSIGLFKKVVLADNLGLVANSAFSNTDLHSYEAWMGILSYSFQIYFDFSGYADMAIALALLFGIRLPMNFNSPYKSVNLVEFWRNWHITLSNFLRDHIYIPLGGSRVKIEKQAFNLLFTMGVGGLWHGAGWNFIVWGLAHGLFLALLHVRGVRLPKYMSILVTFLMVTLLWVLFRADDLGSALAYYKVLFDFSSFGLGSFSFDKEFLIVLGFFVVWGLPNSLELIGYMKEKFSLSLWHSFVGAILFFIALKMMASSPAVNFVYFNF